MRVVGKWIGCAAVLSLACGDDGSGGSASATASSTITTASTTTPTGGPTGSGSMTSMGTAESSSGTMSTTSPTSSSTTDTTTTDTTTDSTTTMGSDSGTTVVMTGSGTDTATTGAVVTGTGTTMGVSDTGTTGMASDPMWLLSIDNATHWLQVVNIFTGEATNLCQLNTLVGYPSLTFNRDNRLFASRSGNFLDEIDPCTCDIVPVGSYGVFSGVNGITSDQAIGLYGVASTQDVLISIDPDTGMGMQIGALGFNFGTNGATWSDMLDDLYSIDGTSDDLYIIDHMTGMAAVQANLSLGFGTVGIELHPFNGIIYACSSPADLYEVDPMTGDVMVIGPMGQQGNCTNLAAPYKNVACIPDP